MQAPLLSFGWHPIRLLHRRSCHVPCLSDKRIVMVEGSDACTSTNKKRKTQLLFTLRVRGPNGNDRFLTAVVDTGECVNLIKRGCLTDPLVASPDPFPMVTASGQALQGGDQEINLEMDFRLKNPRDFGTKTE